MILSEIEQRIKAKIEAIGTPLKEWNVNIYRGILTGYNDAFIIDKAKKEEILANCQSDEERKKTDELIRPILRGRDIKRYGYDFADLYLINTHNGVKEKGIKRIHIEDYPAVKAHLDLYYPQLEKRADQGDTPYNLRNCAYIEDFFKQKIVYPETTQGAYFALDINKVMLDKTCFMIISDKPKFLIALLSSRLYEFSYKSIFSSIELGVSGYQYNKHALIRLPIIEPSQEIEQEIITLLDQKEYSKIDTLVYKLYNLSEEEIKFIENI
ncbi:TaqI-like C-terminal specificity domain-containing protein [Capnocytophaga gingivalis]